MSQTEIDLLDADLHSNLLKDNSNRLRLVNIGLIITLVALVLDAIVLLLYFNFVGDSLGNYENYEIYDRLTIINGLTGSIAILFFGISFIAWLARGYKNVELSKQKTVYPYSQSIYSWFIPIFNLFRPFQIIKDLKFKMERVVKKVNPEYVYSNEQSMNIWWVLFVISSVLSRFTLFRQNQSDMYEEYKDVVYLSLSNVVIDMVALLLLYQVLRNFASLENDFSRSYSVLVNKAE